MVRRHVASRRWTAGAATVALIVGGAVVGTVAPAEAATHYRVDTVHVGKGPTAVGLDPSAHRAFVTLAEDDAVSVIDTASNTAQGDPIDVAGPFGSGPRSSDPTAIAVDPQAHRAYVVANRSGVLTVIDTSSDAVVDQFFVGSQPRAIALDADAHRAYVTNAVDQEVAVVDTSSDQVVSRIPVTGTPYGVALDPGIHRAYVTFPDTDTVSVIDTATDQVVGSPLSVGSVPRSVAVDPVAHRAYVANSGSASVSVVNTSSNTVVGYPVKVSQGPSSVAVDPGAQRAYVADRDADVVSVIDTSSNTVVGDPVPVGQNPVGVAVDPGTHAVYVANYDDDNYADDTVSVISSDSTGGITFTSTPPATPRVGDTYEVSATNGFSGERVRLSIDPSSTSTCTIADHGDSTGTVSLTSVGSCLVDADQAGSPQVTQRLDVSKGQQVITFTPSDPGARRVGTTYVVRAAGGSGHKPVTIRAGGRATAHPVCTVADQGNGTAKVTFKAAGQCIIVARQDGSTNYEPAPAARQSVTSYQTKSIDVGGPTDSIAVYPGRHRAYVVGSNTVTVVDTSTNDVVGRPIAVGHEAQVVAVDPSTRQVYVASQAADIVAVIDATTDKVVRRIPVGRDPVGVAVDPDTHQVYVANSGDDTVTVIDTTTNAVVGDPIPVGDDPIQVAVDPTTHRAYVVNDLVSGYVNVINTLSNTIVGSAISVGVFPTGIAVDPGTHHAYVTKVGGNAVVVIDTSTNTASRDEIPVGEFPSGVAVDPDLHRAYVANGSDHTVSTIDTTTDALVGDPIPLPGVVQVAVDHRTHRVYVTTGTGKVSVILPAGSS